MTPIRGGVLLGVGLAFGIAVGAAGSALAASPAPAGPGTAATATPWGQMIDGFLGMTGGHTMVGDREASTRIAALRLDIRLQPEGRP